MFSSRSLVSLVDGTDDEKLGLRRESKKGLSRPYRVPTRSLTTSLTLQPFCVIVSKEEKGFVLPLQGKVKERTRETGDV